MSETEFRGWLAYDQLYPLPDPHWDAALIASTMMRAMGSKTARLVHYLPVKDSEKQRTGPTNGAAILAGIRRLKARLKYGNN